MNNPVGSMRKGKSSSRNTAGIFFPGIPCAASTDRFYTVDGPLPDENKLKRTIYEEISPWLHDKVAQTVEQVIRR